MRDTNTTPPLVGGITELNSNKNKYGKFTQYTQQSRVYRSDYLSMCLCGNIPGGSYLYLVEEIDNEGNK